MAGGELSLNSWHPEREDSSHLAPVDKAVGGNYQFTLVFEFSFILKIQCEKICLDL